MEEPYISPILLNWSPTKVQTQLSLLTSFKSFKVIVLGGTDEYRLYCRDHVQKFVKESIETGKQRLKLEEEDDQRLVQYGVVVIKCVSLVVIENGDV